MGSVTVSLATPWPTALGLRRPQEGPIVLSEAEAEAIIAAGAGVIVETGGASSASEQAPRPARRARQASAAAASAASAE